MTCWKWALLLLATTAAAGWSAHAAPVCPLLDASGCCGGQCRVALCAALYDFGFALVSTLEWAIVSMACEYAVNLPAEASPQPPRGQEAAYT